MWLHDQLPNQNFHATLLGVIISPCEWSLWIGGLCNGKAVFNSFLLSLLSVCRTRWASKNPYWPAKMFLIELWGSLRFLGECMYTYNNFCTNFLMNILTNFFDASYLRFPLTNFLEEINFFDEFLTNFLPNCLTNFLRNFSANFLMNFLTYNLLTIASFK